MGRIDKETQQRILDTAEIVDVVSDFVHLTPRGANHIGLCPFHNDRKPSFYVSKAKGIFKCFACGKGGRCVDFIMEHEQLSYPDALRYLAKKYHIEIKERELTDKEREEASQRESLFAANDFALSHFEHNLADTPDGQNIGLTYFRERGINDWAIKRFRLGYSINRSDDLLKAARAAGIGEQYLIESGLCIKNDRGQVYDRFKGRVMYPIFTLSGKVVAFGGRTLRKEKDVAKYVNSPESSIYLKRRELYGLFQAKQAIIRKDKCIIVEGYMDVISMHQSGVENVVASSGTALTPDQIRLIHRFTENVTLIYDSDPAGIKASLRGIDLLLGEGLNIKVLLLPAGDDPDSFAQSHTAEQLEQYLSENETDFIRFKTDVLLKGTANDPISISHAITDIVGSISMIPDDIQRSVYVKECSRRFDIDEKVLARQVARNIAQRREQESKRSHQASSDSQASATSDNATSGQPDAADTTAASTAQDSVPPQRTQTKQTPYPLEPYERHLLRLVLKYGLVPLSNPEEQEAEFAEEEKPTVVDMVHESLSCDDLDFTVPLYSRALAEALRLRREDFVPDLKRFLDDSEQKRQEQWDEGEAKIRLEATDLADINKRQVWLKQQCDEEAEKRLANFREQYVERTLGSCPDDELRHLVNDLVSDRHQLSKVHTKYTHVVTESERINEIVPRKICELKYAIIRQQFAEVQAQLAEASRQTPYDVQTIRHLMEKQIQLKAVEKKMATYLGERVIDP